MDAMLGFDGKSNGLFFQQTESTGEDSNLGTFDVHLYKAGNFKVAAGILE